MYWLLIFVMLFMIWFYNFLDSSWSYFNSNLLLDMKKTNNYYKEEYSYEFIKKIVLNDFIDLKENYFYNIQISNNEKWYVLSEETSTWNILFPLLDKNIKYSLFITNKTWTSTGMINLNIKSFINNDKLKIWDENFIINKN